MIKNILSKLKAYAQYTPNNALIVPELSIVFLLISLIINSLLLGGSGIFLIIFAPVSLVLPCMLYFRSMGYSKWEPKIVLPKKHHILFLIFAFIALCSGSLLLNFICERQEYLLLYGAFSSKTKNFFLGVLYFISFGIIAPVCEEILFRGVLLRRLEKIGTLPAILISSLLFSFIDFEFSALPARFFAGIILCLIYYATRSFVTVSAIHILFNIFALYLQPLFLAMRKVSGQSELFLLLVAIFALLALALFFNQAALIYRRHQSNEESKDKAILGKTPIRALEYLLSSPVVFSALIFLIVAFIKIA